MESMMYSYANEGMKTMDASLLELYQKGQILAEDAKFYSFNPELISKKINN